METNICVYIYKGKPLALHPITPHLTTPNFFPPMSKYEDQ